MRHSLVKNIIKFDLLLKLEHVQIYTTFGHFGHMDKWKISSEIWNGQRIKTPPNHLINTIEYFWQTVLNKHRNRSEPVQKRFDFISFHWNICVFFKQITSNYHSYFISSSRLNQQKPICTHTKQPYKIHEPTSIVYKHFTLLSRVYCLFAPYNLNCKNNRNNIIYNNTFLIRI